MNIRKLLLTWAFLTGTVITAAAQKPSCCSPSASQEFAMLGSNKSFQGSHLSPLPFTYNSEAGTFITFKTADGNEGRAFEVKPARPNGKYVFMFHEWWGLNDYIKREAEKLQKELGDVTVLAIDLYDGKLTTSADEAGKLMQDVKEERATAIIKGALEYAGQYAKIGTLGWCFGGGWSLQASIIAGKQSQACVIYYGMPEKDEKKIKELNAPVLGLFAKKDGWITPEVVGAFEKSMQKEGKKVTIKFYDADHAFANPSNPKHDKAASEDAHKQAVAFLKQHLK